MWLVAEGARAFECKGDTGFGRVSSPSWREEAVLRLVIREERAFGGTPRGFRTCVTREGIIVQVRIAATRDRQCAPCAFLRQLTSIAIHRLSMSTCESVIIVSNDFRLSLLGSVSSTLRHR